MFGRRKLEYKTDDQIRLMRLAGLVVADAHDAVREAMRPGVTTADLDVVAAEVIRSAGAQPSFLGYHGFPATICVSVNDEVVHGIPGDRVLADGDLVSIDCGAIVQGWHGDAAFTAIVGTPRPPDVALSEATQQAMWAGIAAAATGDRVGDIGDAVEDEIAERYGIVRDYVGHGIGSAMHLPPDVPNYRTGHRGPALRPGLCLAVEPMVLGSVDDHTRVLDDEWTVVSTGGARAAHWEHTVALTSRGPWVLTAHDGGEAALAERGVSITPLAD